MRFTDGGMLFGRKDSPRFRCFLGASSVGGVVLPNGAVFAISVNGEQNDFRTPDVGLSRIGPAHFAIGNGNSGSTTGRLSLTTLQLVPRTVSELAAITAGSGLIGYCSNESGGAVPVSGDGTNWRRVTDRAIIS